MHRTFPQTLSYLLSSIFSFHKDSAYQHSIYPCWDQDNPASCSRAIMEDVTAAFSSAFPGPPASDTETRPR